MWDRITQAWRYIIMSYLQIILAIRLMNSWSIQNRYSNIDIFLDYSEMLKSWWWCLLADYTCCETSRQFEHVRVLHEFEFDSWSFWDAWKFMLMSFLQIILALRYLDSLKACQNSLLVLFDLWLFWDVEMFKTIFHLQITLTMKI